MLVKIYWIVWAVTAVAAFSIYALGAFSPLVTVTFGFIVFGIVFMGMISVLPSMVSHPAPPKQRKVQVPARTNEVPAAREGLGVLKSA
jgi:hypothetical protein